MSRELLKKALNYIDYRKKGSSDFSKAVVAELAKPEPEPIFYASKSLVHGGFLPCEKEFKGDSVWSHAVPLYTNPPCQLSPLSEDAIEAFLQGAVRLPPGWLDFARAIERAHGIGVEE